MPAALPLANLIARGHMLSDGTLSPKGEAGVAIGVVIFVLARFASLSLSLNVVMINKATSDKAKLGSMYGTAQSFQAASRAVAPAFVSSIRTVCQEKHPRRLFRLGGDNESGCSRRVRRFECQSLWVRGRSKWNKRRDDANNHESGVYKRDNAQHIDPSAVINVKHASESTAELCDLDWYYDI
ncbi:hypothetical protein BOTBODRAFT_628588 [Botryobasidium botryosum FD-172 SS1]|uniref:Uncharacterized protein n=1 Tax=Botryobasidium botryosum (strain FD-172 SS1) TaxID=930990 RepID=A0A067MT12_BOTB1|nr:hypothetical protein BOTBODRAFT_628588 [Botryobasidium botryosum FD-172 SS1]